MALDGQRFCLKWNDFRNSVTAVFEDLRQDEELVDITLCCEGKKVKAHRMMLSACSPYFRELLKENPCQHPVFFLKDTTYSDLKAVIEFVYNGEVNVTQGQLSSFLKTAEMLQVRGLTGDEDKDSAAAASPARAAAPPAAPAPMPAAPPRAFPRRPSAPPQMAPARQLATQRARQPVQPPAPPMPQKRPAPPGNSFASAPPEVVSVLDSPPEPRPPESPASKRRRNSGSSSNDGPATPAAPDSAPSPLSAAASPAAAGDAPPPPPPPPPPVAGPAQPPASAAPQAEAAPYGGVKVEKIDIQEEDESMAALGQVVEFEGSYDSDQSLGAVPMHDPSQGGMYAAGTSDAGAGSGSAEGDLGCPICLKRFRSASSWYQHRRTHQGLTNCPICGKFLNRVYDVGRHMLITHRMPKHEIDRLLAGRR